MVNHDVNRQNFDAVIRLPFCHLGICFDGDALIKTEYLKRLVKPRISENRLVRAAVKEIEDYCRNAEKTFSVKTRPAGTDFQLRVWQQLVSIPAGQVMTYGEIARKLSSSAQAVGNACRSNPVPLIIPCHRVVAATGLGGFAGQTEGYFTDIKRQLLRHEGLEI